jgi:hypothetical protein
MSRVRRSRDAFALPTFATPSRTGSPRRRSGSQSLVVEKRFATLTSVEVGFGLAGRLCLAGAFGVGGASLFDPAGSGQDGSRVVEARVGVGRLGCGRVGCLGAVGALGYHRQRNDGLLDPPMYTEKRDLAFGELRGIARPRRARSGARSALPGRGRARARRQRRWHRRRRHAGIHATF